jgi:hypothetical protein
MGTSIRSGFHWDYLTPQAAHVEKMKTGNTYFGTVPYMTKNAF